LPKKKKSDKRGGGLSEGSRGVSGFGEKDQKTKEMG